MDDTQLALFPIEIGTEVRRTYTGNGGEARTHKGRVTFATQVWIFYECDKAECACRIDRSDRAYAPHRVATPRP